MTSWKHTASLKGSYETRSREVDSGSSHNRLCPALRNDFLLKNSGIMPILLWINLPLGKSLVGKLPNHSTPFFMYQQGEVFFYVSFSLAAVAHTYPKNPTKPNSRLMALIKGLVGWRRLGRGRDNPVLSFTKLPPCAPGSACPVWSVQGRQSSFTGSHHNSQLCGTHGAQTDSTAGPKRTHRLPTPGTGLLNHKWEMADSGGGIVQELFSH